jgi:hypothetical protein
MTKRWSRFDRQDRLLRACRRLLVEIRNASDRSVEVLEAPRSREAEDLYRRARVMVGRIDRELTTG